jgi:hypothetical protein
MTTRLDAVNTILTASGEQSVSSLSNATADVANAGAILDEVSREVQAEGWHFNTDDDVPLAPNVSNQIALGANVIKVDIDIYRYPTLDVVQRGSRLYDKRNRTYSFTQTLKAEVVYFLPFEDLPEQARRYIAMKAARVFHTRFIGSTAGFQFTEREESDARASLQKSNLANADINLFRSNPETAYRLRR